MARPTTIDLSGPFFTRDPRRTFRSNARAMLEAMAREGEQDVKVQFPVYTGAGQAGVRGRVAALSGRPWAVTMVVSQQHVYPWPGGGPKQYRGGRLEARKHMFRTTAGRLRRAKAINMAELVKGLT